jgi:hypothetical protein
MPDTTPAFDHPPRPRMVFRLGVVGRRFARRNITPSPKLETTVAEVLRLVDRFVACQRRKCAASYAEVPPVLRVVSSLAEGADQFVAEMALKTGFELQCPFPFPETVYRKEIADDHPPAAEAFDRLLREAGTNGKRVVKLELDGDPACSTAAYRASARVVAAQADLLLALWDGRPDDADCGTVFAIRYALLHQVPVLWLDLTAAGGWQWLRAIDDLPESIPVTGLTPKLNPPPLKAILKQVVAGVIAPPLGAKSDQLHHGVPETELADYLSERRRRWNLAFPWKLFRDLFACETPEKLTAIKIQSLEAPSPEEKRPGELDWLRTDEWSEKQPTGRPPAVLDPATDALHPHYGWADRLANWYADHYRSSFVGIYVLGTAAVALVLVCLLMGWWTGPRFHAQEMACAAVEATLIGSIVWLIHCGRKHQWHGRWMDCRLLAERIRELRFLAGTGGARPLMRHPAFAGHLASYGDPDATWMAWLVRALERELGLLPITVNAAYLRELIGHVRVALVAEQDRYHRNTADRMARIDHRLHRLGQRLFALTLAVCVGHLLLLVLGVPLPMNVVRIALGIGAAFPLLGAALTALRDQGEFQRVAARSEAMRQRMAKFGRELDALERQLDAGQTGSRAVFELVQVITQAMVHENLGWRVIFQDRPLREPG